MRVWPNIEGSGDFCCKYWSFHVARAQSMDEDEDMDQKLKLYVSVGID